jgi:hypothetical protein
VKTLNEKYIKVWRKNQELGLAGIYKSSEHIRKLLKLPQTLAFVPVEDVVDLFQEIFLSLRELESDYKCKIVEFYEYFEKYYVGGILEVNKSRGRKPKNPKPVERYEPMFKIEQWSVYSGILNQI